MRIMIQLGALLLTLLANSGKAQILGSEASPFYWQSQQLNDQTYPNAALLLPFQIGRDTVFLQLDLGMAGNVLYQPALDQLDPEAINQQDGTITLSGKLNQQSFREEFQLYQSVADSQMRDLRGKPIVGLIGLKAFERHQLTLDFIHQQFSLDQAPPEKANLNASNINCRLAGHKLLINLKGKGSPWVIYDSGSSPFGLITDRDYWQTLTQKTLDNPSVRNLTLSPSHTNQEQGLRLACDTISQQLKVGSLPVKTACTRTTGAFNIRAIAPDARAVMGNQPFIDRAILHLDFQNVTCQILEP